MARGSVKHNFGKQIDSMSIYSYPLLQIARVNIDNAALASATAVHAAVTLLAEVQNVTTAITNPAVPRNVTVKGNQAGVAGDVVITGTNVSGATITETIPLNGANEVVGNKAFKTVTNINLPVLVGVGDTVSIGTGAKLGLPYKLTYATDILRCYFDGSVETLAAQAVSATAIESNTVTTTTALNGVKDLVLDILVK